MFAKFINKILDSSTTPKFENCDMKLDNRFPQNSEKKFVKMATEFYQISKDCSRELETCRPMLEGPLLKSLLSVYVFNQVNTSYNESSEIFLSES